MVSALLGVLYDFKQNQRIFVNNSFLLGFGPCFLALGLPFVPLQSLQVIFLFFLFDACLSGRGCGVGEFGYSLTLLSFNS